MAGPIKPASGPIFIAYRREDASGYAGLVFDTLARTLGYQSVFRDIDSISPGSDWEHMLKDAISRCKVLLVVMGPNWLAPQGDGTRRIDDPHDFVRLEIETALELRLRVVPLLIADTRMPSRSQLPQPLAGLADQLSLELRDELLEHDLGLLVFVLKAMISETTDSLGESEPDKWLSSEAPIAPVRSESGRKLRVFLCHSSSDKPSVRRLYTKLRNEGIEPWLDEEDILPGQDWDFEIQKAIRTSDIVIVCLSEGSVSRVGYLQKEIKSVLDVADEQPLGSIFLIPLRLEPCDVPERFRKWQWVDLFDDNGYIRLRRALHARAGVLAKDQN